MEKIEDLIYKYTCRNNEKIKKITEPLHSVFGITEFWHFRVFGDGTFTFLGSAPDVNEYYYGSHFYKKSPFFKHPDQLKSAFFLSNSLRHEGYRWTQGEIEKKFNMQLPFNIIRKEEGFSHEFGFSTRNPDFPLDTVCINYLYVLNRFCDFFIEETASIQEKILEEKFNIGHLVGDSFRDPFPFPQDLHPNLKEFYKKLKRINSCKYGTVQFTQQEKRCLSYFLKRKTYREIAEALHLSPRSVETYFQVIKEKLNCDTQSELFSSVSELNQFGLLTEED
jgi:DNA-binding CsgD family transcriptional regulator